MDPLNDFPIDYEGILREAAGLEGDALIACVTPILIDCWIDDYWDMVDHRPYILDVPDRGFNFLFDLTLASYDKNDPDRPDDRVVAAYGRSKTTEEKRDASRIRGFGKIGNRSRGSMDKGHPDGTHGRRRAGHQHLSAALGREPRPLPRRAALSQDGAIRRRASRDVHVLTSHLRRRLMDPARAGVRHSAAG
ncbi:MAG TPA: hypothetical protein VF006_10205 [Longimicrobium sp.]